MFMTLTLILQLFKYVSGIRSAYLLDCERLGNEWLDSSLHPSVPYVEPLRCYDADVLCLPP